MGQMMSWMAEFALLWVVIGSLLAVLLVVVIVKLLQQ